MISSWAVWVETSFDEISVKQPRGCQSRYCSALTYLTLVLNTRGVWWAVMEPPPLRHMKYLHNCKEPQECFLLQVWCCTFVLSYRFTLSRNCVNAWSTGLETESTLGKSTAPFNPNLGRGTLLGAGLLDVSVEIRDAVLPSEHLSIHSKQLHILNNGFSYF